MFGLMKGAQRLPYCGTCKTMGAMYGQRTRLLLNHDAVFLAELLIAHSAEPEWANAYRSFNCASIPRTNHPVALEFAATMAVTLAHFTIADHRADLSPTQSEMPWRAVQRFFSFGYRKAAGNLLSWNFPVGKLDSILATQRQREATPLSLSHVAEPTAVATALFFLHGARRISRPDLEESLADIGHRFGTLIYLLDAHEDRARDARSGDFNAFAAFPGIEPRQEILRHAAELEPLLPSALASRLRVNVEERLGLRLRVLRSRCRKTAADRWRDALLFARKMKSNERAGLLKGALIFSTSALVAFLIPHQARSAESWRHCMSLGMNVMALGGVLAMGYVPPPIHEQAGKAAETTSTGGGCCPSCDCDGCCDCGSCCDGCGSCEC